MLYKTDFIVWLRYLTLKIWLAGVCEYLEFFFYYMSTVYTCYDANFIQSQPL